MAKISIAITTPTALILDPDGRAGTGTVTIKPNAPFQYTSGSVYQVTDETVQVAISEGMLVSALNLAPNAGASNLPETYYIVTIDVNTVSWVEYWQLQNTPTSLTWGEVTRVAGPNAASPNALASHLAAPNPHPQYVLEAVTLDAATIGSYNGRGGIPRVDPATGKLPASFYDAFPSGTKILFSGTLPTGWTQDSTAALNGAMLVGTTGVASSGGSADPKTMAHTHLHALTIPNHAHNIEGSTFGVFNTDLTAGATPYDIVRKFEDGPTDTDGGGGAVAGTITAKDINPKYYEVMVGVKS